MPLAVRDSIRDELGCSGDAKVARHFARKVVELIRLGPDIGAGAGDLVLPVEVSNSADPLSGGAPTSSELVKAPNFPV